MAYKFPPPTPAPKPAYTTAYLPGRAGRAVSRTMALITRAEDRVIATVNRVINRLTPPKADLTLRDKAGAALGTNKPAQAPFESRIAAVVRNDRVAMVGEGYRQQGLEMAKRTSYAVTADRGVDVQPDLWSSTRRVGAAVVAASPAVPQKTKGRSL